MNRFAFWQVVPLLTLVACSLAFGQANSEKKEAPGIKTVTPFGIIAGSTSTVTVRGLRLADCQQIRFLDLKTAPAVSIKSQGTAKPPDKVPPEKVGDSQVEFQVAFPPDLPFGPVRFVVVTPVGESQPQEVLLLDPSLSVSEKEPNDGFSSAQRLTLGAMQTLSVLGTLAPGQNVDVYRIDCKAGQKISVDIRAARSGSLLDPFLLFHNSQGQLLLEADDGPDSVDPQFSLELPTDGAYYLSVLDAHDKDSPLHGYILTIK